MPAIVEVEGVWGRHSAKTRRCLKAGLGKLKAGWRDGKVHEANLPTAARVNYRYSSAGRITLES